MADPKVKDVGGATCPICGTPLPEGVKTLPFCSTRCRMVDLNRWLGGDYRISRSVEQRDIEEGE